MSIILVDNFQLNLDRPLDNRFVVGPGQFYSNRNDIIHKYPGLRIYDLNDSLFYFWTGASFSVESQGGGGNVSAVSGQNSYLTRFVGTNNITTSQIFDNNFNIGFGTNTFGSEKFRFSGGHFRIDGGQLRVGSGNSSEPSYTFNSNTSTGIFYKPTPVSLAISVAGSEQLAVINGEVQIGHTVSTGARVSIKSNDNSDFSAALRIYSNNLTQNAQYSWGGVSASSYYKINSGGGQSIWMNNGVFVSSDGKLLEVTGGLDITKNLVAGGRTIMSCKNNIVSPIGPFFPEFVSNSFTVDDNLGNPLYFAGGTVYVEVEFVSRLIQGRASSTRLNKRITTFTVNNFGVFTQVGNVEVINHDTSSGNIFNPSIDVSTPGAITFISQAQLNSFGEFLLTTVNYKIILAY